MYFNANWIGNLAIATAGISYLSFFFPIFKHAIPSGLAVICLIWILTGMNILGSRWIGRLVIIGVTLLLIPIVLTGTYGWLFFKPTVFMGNWNISHHDDISAIFFGCFALYVVLCGC